MKHELILKREDGSQVKINVELYINNYIDEFEYRISLEKKEKGKRKWLRLEETWRGWDYQCLRNQSDRQGYITGRILETVTEGEILQAKMELWEKLKPAIKQSGE